MHFANIYPTLFQLAVNVKYALGLHCGVGFVILIVAVGSGIVGEHSLNTEVFKGEHFFNIVGIFLGAAVKSDACHSRIYGDMQAYLAFGCAFAELLGIVGLGARLDDVACDKVIGVFVRGVAKDEYLALDAHFTKRLRFIKICHCKMLYTKLAFEIRHDNRGIVTVAIGFHHAHELCFIVQERAVILNIAAQCRKVDLCIAAF